MSMAGTFSAEAADKFPPIWRKSMTNDPGTNYFLNKYSASLNDPASTAIRNIMLARVVGSECQSSRLSKAKVRAYRDSMLGSLSSDALKAAAFAAGSELRNFDYETLAHLCAGIDYQFGPKGVLIAGAVSSGKGEPRYSYDQRNPYIRLPDFTGK
ncbi:hypothetical protein [Mesorhizobium sp.]|nr:hypothetical protein [Mesorhizobium sp.]